MSRILLERTERERETVRPEEEATIEQKKRVQSEVELLIEFD